MNSPVRMNVPLTFSNLSRSILTVVLARGVVPVSLQRRGALFRLTPDSRGNRGERALWVLSQGADKQMMRSCRTCRWYRPDPDERTGRCANPEFEAEPGLQLTVRAKELHCRRGWNDDRWTAATDDIVLEIRFKAPGQADEEPVRKPATSQRAIELRSVESIVSAWDEPARAEADTQSPRP